MTSSAPLRRALPVLLALAAPAGAAAQGAPCTAEENRAFDFWAGHWDVTVPNGGLAGRNSIRPAMGGCALHEHYLTPRGYEGESLNVYDASRGVWRR